MKPNSPLARSLKSIPFIGKLSDKFGNFLKSGSVLVVTLLAIPFIGPGPLIFGLLFKAASAASFVAVTKEETGGKRRLPFGLIFVILVGLGLSIYTLWPASSTPTSNARIEASQTSNNLDWMRSNTRALGDRGLISTGDAKSTPGIVLATQAVFVRLTGSDISGAGGLMTLLLGGGLVAIVLLVIVKPYLLSDPENFARDAEGLFRLTQASKLGNIGRSALTEVDEVLKGHAGKTRGERMASLVDASFSNHPNALMRGDLQAAADELFPFDKNWRKSKNLKNIEWHVESPCHIVTSFIEDGMLSNGESPTVLIPMIMLRGHVERAYDAVIKAAVPAEGALGVSGYFLATAVFFAVANGMASLLPPHWIFLLSSIAVAGVSAFSAWKYHEASSIARLASAMLRPCNIATILNRVVNARPEMSTITKDSVVRRAERLKDLANNLEKHRLQIFLADRDPFSLNIFGTATGTTLARGSLNGYLEGQQVCSTRDDLARGGSAYTGPTGTGKSHAHLEPRMAQAMDEEEMFLEEDYLAAKDNMLVECKQSATDEFVSI